jgi:predicted RNA binding protein YcfA (HicA-like mRNA interferase family)
MGHYAKLYREIKNNPYNVRFEDIDKLLTKVGGFEVRNTASSHYIYYHPDWPDNLSIPKDRPVKPIYIKKALKAFEALNPSFLNGGD